MLGNSPLWLRAFLIAFAAHFFSHVVTHAAEARRATASPQLVNGFVVGLTVTDPGSGYTTAPAVLILGGGGSGATATAQIQNGAVTGFTITDAGIGYTSAPEIRIGSPHFAPSVDVAISQVKVTLTVILGQRYQLMSSADLVQWTTVAESFVAENETVEQEIALAPTARFFTLAQLQ